MYYVRLTEGGFKWRYSEGGELLPDIGRRQLLWLRRASRGASPGGRAGRRRQGALAKKHGLTWEYMG